MKILVSTTTLLLLYHSSLHSAVICSTKGKYATCGETVTASQPGRYQLPTLCPAKYPNVISGSCGAPTIPAPAWGTYVDLVVNWTGLVQGGWGCLVTVNQGGGVFPPSVNIYHGVLCSKN